ncbi:MAG: hypothetical protein QXT63_09255 [Thermoplasmata archaeon]
MTEMPREFYRKKFPFGEGLLDELERTKEFSFGTGLGFGEIDYILSRNRDLQGDIDKLRMRALRLQQDPREEIENKIYSKN